MNYMKWLEGLKEGAMVGINAHHEDGETVNQYVSEVMKFREDGVLIKNWGWFSLPDGIREHMVLAPLDLMSEEAWRMYLVTEIQAVPLMGVSIAKLRRIRDILNEGEGE